MFDLDTGVHFQEEEIPRVGIDHEFHRSRPGIAFRCRQRAGGFGHAIHRGARQTRRGAFLDDFLEPALQRTVAFEQMHRPTVAKAEDLDFHMPGAGDESFQKHRAIAKTACGGSLGAFDGLAQLGRRIHPLHADPAAPGRRLDQQGIANRVGGLVQPVQRPFGEAVRAGQDRNPGGNRQIARALLVAHVVDRVRIGADPGQAGRLDRPGESRAFGQKPIPRMHRIGAGAQRGIDHRIMAQIALRRLRRADGNALVRHGDMQRVCIGFREHGDRGDLQRAGGADDAAGDLAAIGDQKLLHAALTSGTCDP